MSYSTDNCPDCGSETSGEDGHKCHDCADASYGKTEQRMRSQMLLTMRAIQEMAKAVVDHLTADKRPPEQNENSRVPRGERQTARLIDDVVIRGLKIEGDLQVEGTTAPLDSDIAEIRKTLDQLRKALAVVSVFGEFKDAGVFGAKPSDQVARIIGLRVCEECVGTGWIARDETCKNCGQRGYLKA